MSGHLEFDLILDNLNFFFFSRFIVELKISSAVEIFLKSLSGPLSSVEIKLLSFQIPVLLSKEQFVKKNKITKI